MVQGRGLDFAQRFNTSRWAETLAFNALNLQKNFICIRFGLSIIRDSGQLAAYSAAAPKEPDLVVLNKRLLPRDLLAALVKLELDVSDIERNSADFLKLWKAIRPFAIASIEIEFSPYRAADMKGRNWEKRELAKLIARPLKHAKSPTAPNIFIKEEDLPRLADWQSQNKIPIFVLHVFDQESFAIKLSDVRIPLKLDAQSTANWTVGA